MVFIFNIKYHRKIKRFRKLHLSEYPASKSDLKRYTHNESSLCYLSQVHSSSYPSLQQLLLFFILLHIFIFLLRMYVFLKHAFSITCSFLKPAVNSII